MHSTLIYVSTWYDMTHTHKHTHAHAHTHTNVYNHGRLCGCIWRLMGFCTLFFCILNNKDNHSRFFGSQICLKRQCNRGIWGSNFWLTLPSPLGSRAHVGGPQANFTSWSKKSWLPSAKTFSQRFNQICDFCETCYTDKSPFCSRDQHGPYFSLTRPAWVPLFALETSMGPTFRSRDQHRPTWDRCPDFCNHTFVLPLVWENAVWSWLFHRQTWKIEFKINKKFAAPNPCIWTHSWCSFRMRC